MNKFPSIDSFHHAVKYVRNNNGYHQYNGDPESVINRVKYIGTAKLHGSNGSIAYDRQTGEVSAFSRERPLTIESDNYGFAFWVEANKDAIRAFINKNVPTDRKHITVFGEWLGKGIQKGVAVSELDKHFVAFSYLIDGVWHHCNLPDEAGPFRVITEVPVYHVEIDFNNPTTVLADIEALTEAVEQECPWGKLNGVTGIGEGIVWVPLDRDYRQNTSLWFKSKGLKHKAPNKEGHKVTVDPAVVEGINALVQEVLPEWRLEQGISYLRENGKEIDTKNTGEYIKWIHKDILKECTDQIAANGFEWRQLTGPVSTKAREYYLKTVQETSLEG
jgi:hypothetical protein